MFSTLDKWASVGDVLCVPAVHSPLITQRLGPAGPMVGSDLCLWTQFCRLQGHNFLASGVCSLEGEVCLEPCVGFLAGASGACPLVRGAGSWPSGGQGHVKGCI